MVATYLAQYALCDSGVYLREITFSSSFAFEYESPECLLFLFFSGFALECEP